MENILLSVTHEHYHQTLLFFKRIKFIYFVNSREAAKAVFRIHSFGDINCVSAINKGRGDDSLPRPWHYRQLHKVAIPSNGDCMTA